MDEQWGKFESRQVGLVDSYFLLLSLELHLSTGYNEIFQKHLIKNSLRPPAPGF